MSGNKQKQLTLSYRQSQKNNQNQNHAQQSNNQAKLKNKNFKSEHELTQLLENCEDIIREQCLYISKLERDIQRKDSIISNLVKKQSIHQSNKQKASQLSTQDSLEEVQRLSQKLRQLYSKYEQTLASRQSLQKQIQAKDKFIKQLSVIVGNQKQREKQLQHQVQQYKDMAHKLKQAYEAKITILLTELRKKVEDDIQKSRQKKYENSQAQTLRKDQNIQYGTSERSNHGYLNQQAQNPENRRLLTPTKDINVYKNTEKAQKQMKQYDESKTVSRNIRKNWIRQIQIESKTPSAIKKLINTPYKRPNNFITSHSKVFPTVQVVPYAQDLKISKQAEKNQKNGTKMLLNGQDAQFMTDNEEDYSEASLNSRDSSRSGRHSQTSPQNDKQYQNRNLQTQEGYLNKIPLQTIMKQLSKYQEQSPGPKQNQKEGSRINRMKINEVLEKLSIKIKRFENDNIDYE